MQPQFKIFSRISRSNIIDPGFNELFGPKIEGQIYNSFSLTSLCDGYFFKENRHYGIQTNI